MFSGFSDRYFVLAVITTLVCLFVFSGTAKVAISSTADSVAQPIPEHSTASSSSQATEIDQAARADYEAGRYQDAATGFEQAARYYQSQGDAIRQSLALSNLSLAYQQLGLWHEAAEATTASLALLERGVDNEPAQRLALAQVLDGRGNLELARGQTEQAIATWERAATLYQQLGEAESALRSRISQARALQKLGLYSRAILVLETALQATESPTSLAKRLGDDEISLAERRQLLALPNAASTVAGLRSLAEALQVTGNPRQAQTIVEFAEALARTGSSSDSSLDSSSDSSLGSSLDSSLDSSPNSSPDSSPTDPTTDLSLGNAIRIQAVAQLRYNYMTPTEAMNTLPPPPSVIQQVLQARQIRAAQRFQNQTQEALSYYQQSADAGTAILQLQALLNHFSLLLERQTPEDLQAAVALVPQIESRLADLPAGSTIEAQINFARNLLQLANSNPASQLQSQYQSQLQLQSQSQLQLQSQSQSQSQYLLQAAQFFKSAQEQALQSGDFQAESYALAGLAEVYEQNQQFELAQPLIEQALQKVYGASAANLPHAVNDTELAYRWQRQLGRLLKAQDQIEPAIAAYEAGIAILQQQLRLDIASSNLSYRYAFLQEAEQMHHELLDLLLWDGTSESPSQQNLQRAREITASLLEVEVTSFLQEPCDVVTPKEIDDIVTTQATNTAIIYPIVLPNRLELMVKLPQGELKHYRQANVSQEQVVNLVQQLELDLQEDFTFAAVQTAAQQLYDWFVRPVADELAAQQIDTLVFALNRQLQRIPMAVLFDGNQYLIDRYAVAEILGLSLTNPTRLDRDHIRVLAAGLAEMPTGLPKPIQQNFLPLPNVAIELEQIGRTSEGESFPVVRLVNQEFTRQNFNTRLNETNFSVVHLATHGQFSFDPVDTFLLTANDGTEDPKIGVNALAALFRVRGQIRPSPIELLVLNACETAAGDELATLGIAGTAVRAGARSVIASLWTLADAPSVVFSQEFYQHLGQAEIQLHNAGDTVVNGSKAQALRQAQLKLKQDPRYQHPRYWSAYILAGNWL